MASPQVENGHTQIANEILEHLMKVHLSPNQWQVLLCIIRKTYGFHKKVDYIANSQIVEATGLCKAVVSRSLHALHDLGIIDRNKKTIGFQKDWERWQKLAEQSTNMPREKVSSLANSTPKVSNSANNEELAIPSQELAIRSSKLAISSTKVSSPAVAQKIKDTITKETIQKKVIIDLPDWLDKDSWEAFIDMRKKLRAPPTERAKKLLILELDKLRIAGHDPTEVINQSVMYAWKGLFPIKTIGDKDNARPRANRQDLPKRYTTPEQAGRRQLGDAEWERRHPPREDDLPDM